MFMSVLAVAQMYIYHSFDGLSTLGEYVAPTARYSFGNMGFSSNSCAKMPIDWDHSTNVTMHIGCQKTTTISKVISSGMGLDLSLPGGSFDAVHSCYLDPKD